MLEKKILKTIDNIWPEIWENTLYIYHNPELGGQEFKAVQVLANLLKKYGFKITSPYLGMATAFYGELGKGKPAVYLLAEYDALQEIGHGCGHHLIAGASVGAAIALALLKNYWQGKLVVLGTPAEETVGGKVILVDRGAFRECDAALMFHPGQTAVINISSQALEALEVTFTGNYGHSAGPGEGNPLRALVNLWQESQSYSDNYYPDRQIQGVITSGGTTPNLIPNKVVGKFYLRAGTVFELEEVIRHFEQTAHRFSRQFKTPVQIRQYESRYLPLRTHKGLAQVFLEKTQYLGIKMDKKPYQIVGSMDMGNVSWQVPAIHPYLPLGAGDIPAHTLEFAKKAGGQEGEKLMKLATQALALTVQEIFTNPHIIW